MSRACLITAMRVRQVDFLMPKVCSNASAWQIWQRIARRPKECLAAVAALQAIGALLPD